MLRRGILLLALVAFGLIPVAVRSAPFFGSMGGQPLNAPIVGMAGTSTGNGYWLVASDGGIFAYGDAQFFGSTGGMPLNAPIVGMAPTPDNLGYWLVASDGGIFSFGNATFHGSAGSLPLNKPVVGMAATADGGGYWLVATDGGIFNYGNAAFHGSAGSLPLNKPVVGMAATGDGGGYWLVASDGGIFTYGNAPFHGSAGSLPLNAPIVGMAPTPDGNGYWLVADDGGIFSYNARFWGSTGGQQLNSPIVGMAPHRTGVGYWLVARDGGLFAFPDAITTLSTEVVASGLHIPWDIGFTSDGTMLFTERPGRLNALVDGQVRPLATVLDINTAGESGVLGLAVDPRFADNRQIYVCQSYKVGDTIVDVRVYRWTIPPGYAPASAVRGTAVVTGIDAGAGLHNGCRVRFGPDGMLWVGTGDAASATAPQDLESLAGKVLRVDPDTGEAPADNPFPGSVVYHYGHRNVQGLAFRPGTTQAFAIEHGTYRDDEITLLKPGGNGGWDPTPTYSPETHPMTDLQRHPDANVPVWASGEPTIATSGGVFLTGSQWADWEGKLIVATLKTQHLRLFTLDEAGNVTAHEQVFTGYGRLRTPVQGPDGSLYVTTSNGKNSDVILRLLPG